MQLHHVTRSHPQRKARRIGRGGKRGTYSGRGIKGLGARAGGKFRPEERDILKKIPKLRGYKFKSRRQKPAVVNIADLMRRFPDGALVSPETLLRMGLMRRTKGRVGRVKILGNGTLKKKFVFRDVSFSRSVKEAAAVPATAGVGR
ncbi:MAG: uL15 family ribosomal protein [Candidatus Sungbacteria bacterium]|uniref:Large ribosomal subunit protein uL15 n=1 Tax=Candidatus Sungiibacteriota bacterium TaxID=2750080 RepID=A0A932R1T6_9BACT|nr:uL15 family ribosomal protein [Candidatus Sungbacteria bacterium]